MRLGVYVGYWGLGITAEQQLDLVRGGRIDLAAFWRRLGPSPALAGVIERANFLHIVDHGKRLVPACQLG